MDGKSRSDEVEFLGVQLDEVRNEAGEPSISTPSSPAKVRVIRTDEEVVIARETIRLGVASSHQPLPNDPNASVSRGAD